MARVDELIESKAAAPGWNPRAADVNGWKEPKDMGSSIPHHEAITVIGHSVVQLSLSGHPEFKGLLDGPEGPMARIQDGDLIFTVEDLALLIRWREVFELAAVQLDMGLKRQAKHAKEAGA